LIQYRPDSAQSFASARGQDTCSTSASPASVKAKEPGTSIACPHVPLVSLSTNACTSPPLSAKSPPATQFPADAHDTEVTSAPLPAFRAAVPGTSIAFPQVPLASSTTNASMANELSK
jgi:hypothetical protein